MYGILTRYVGPTDHRGSRIIATGPALRTGGRQTRAVVPYSNDRSGSDVHRPAAESVVAQLRADGWLVTLADSPVTLPDETGLVWPLVYGS